VASLSPLLNRREILRKIHFIAIGVIAVVANYGANQMAQAIGFGLIIAGPVGYVTGGQVNFFLHNFVTWRDRHPTMEGWSRRWLLFMAGNGIGLAINTAALLAYVALGFPQLAAFFAALATSAVFNWLWNDRLSFAHRPLDPPEEESQHEKSEH
jgi:putative flippase GtrA